MVYSESGSQGEGILYKLFRLLPLDKDGKAKDHTSRIYGWADSCDSFLADTMEVARD